jgi:outer membrane assembly lipoprotein YfiO
MIGMMNKPVTADVSGRRFPTIGFLGIHCCVQLNGAMRMLARLALMLPLLACAAGGNAWSMPPEEEGAASDDGQALLGSASSHYQARNYDDAIAAAKRYMSLHPRAPDTVYAMYLLGASYLDQIPDVSRDQARTGKAISALEEVICKFPDSEYAASARRKVEEAREQLAAKEMDIGRYYEKKKMLNGAINRFKVVVTRYQRTRHVEEALMRLTECYVTLGIPGEAQTAAAVLGHNFPDSPWYKDAYSLMKGQGLEPQENNGSWISKAYRLWPPDPACGSLSR